MNRVEAQLVQQRARDAGSRALVRLRRIFVDTVSDPDGVGGYGPPPRHDFFVEVYPPTYPRTESFVVADSAWHPS